MLKLFKHLEKRDWLYSLISLSFIVVQVWLDLKLPDYMSEITMLVQTDGSKIRSVQDQLDRQSYLFYSEVGHQKFFTKKGDHRKTSHVIATRALQGNEVKQSVLLMDRLPRYATNDRFI